MIKQNYSLLSLLALVFITGCTGSIDPSQLNEVQNFLAQYPDATIQTTFLSADKVAERINEIHQDCPELDVKAYNKVEVDSSALTLVAYINEDGITECSLTKNNGGVTTTTLPSKSEVVSLAVVDGSSNDVGKYPAVTIDNEGNPAIVYSTQSGTLKLARCTDPTCLESVNTYIIKTGLLSWVNPDPSITIGPEGPIISYYDSVNKSLYVSTCRLPNSGSSMCDEPFTENVIGSSGNISSGNYNDIAINSNGRPIVAYAKDGNLYFSSCYNTVCNGGPSETRLVDGNDSSRVFGVSLELGSDNNPVITYITNRGDVKTAICHDSNCRSSSIHGIISRMYGSASMTIGENGNPIVAYVLNGEMYAASCVDTACSGVSTHLIRMPEGGARPLRPSIAINTDGNPIISFYDGVSSFGDLAVAVCDDPYCSSSTVRILDWREDVGLYNAIVVGNDTTSNRYPSIAYYDKTNGDLKFAKCQNAECFPSPDTPPSPTTVFFKGEGSKAEIILQGLNMRNNNHVNITVDGIDAEGVDLTVQNGTKTQSATDIKKGEKIKIYSINITVDDFDALLDTASITIIDRVISVSISEMLSVITTTTTTLPNNATNTTTTLPNNATNTTTTTVPVTTTTTTLPTTTTTQPSSSTETIEMVSGFNYVGFPVKMVDKEASDLAGDITKQGGEVISIQKWDTASQTFTSWSPSASQTNNFSITDGEGYIIRLSTPVSFSVSGKSFTAPVAHTYTSGFNLVSYPYLSQSYNSKTLAEGLSELGAEVVSVQRWDASSQTSVSWASAAPDANTFNIENDEAYYVRFTTPPSSSVSLDQGLFSGLLATAMVTFNAWFG